MNFTLFKLVHDFYYLRLPDDVWDKKKQNEESGNRLDAGWVAYFVFFNLPFWSNDTKVIINRLWKMQVTLKALKSTGNGTRKTTLENVWFVIKISRDTDVRDHERNEFSMALEIIHLNSVETLKSVLRHDLWIWESRKWKCRMIVF